MDSFMDNWNIHVVCYARLKESSRGEKNNHYDVHNYTEFEKNVFPSTFITECVINIKKKTATRTILNLFKTDSYICNFMRAQKTWPSRILFNWSHGSNDKEQFCKIRHVYCQKKYLNQILSHFFIEVLAPGSCIILINISQKLWFSLTSPSLTKKTRFLMEV